MQTTVTDSNIAAIRCETTGERRIAPCTTAAATAQSAPIANVLAIGPLEPRIAMPQSARPAPTVNAAAHICARNNFGVSSKNECVRASVEPAQNTPESACSDNKHITRMRTGTSAAADGPHPADQTALE